VSSVNTPCPIVRVAGRRKAGQVLIFLIMVLVILFFVTLWNFDLHKILFMKSLTQNAGDAAALMAARWQGITLNLIGDLNLMQAVALSAGATEAAEAATNMQARLCYVGPMIGLMASQQAAKNNGVFVNPEFTDRLREHARRVREEYPTRTGPGGEMLFPEPYAGCWTEYADMLELIADEGVAAGPDNAHFYTDYTGGHILLMMGFYEAVAGRSWCWFYHHAPTLLQDYENFFPCWWPPLPEIPHAEYINSEIYGLGLNRITAQLNDVADPAVVSLLAARRLGGTNVSPVSATWYGYDTARWSSWRAMAVNGSDPFPAAGPLKTTYDYAGADAAVRIVAEAGRMTPGPRGVTVTNTITWTAAAKPMGHLGDSEKPTAFRLVLPAFHDVRLIPVDASTAPWSGSYHIEWREHIEQHLPEYMVNGPHPSDCWYCQQLLQWEDRDFRQEGVDWLAVNSHLCLGGGGGGGHHRGGGRRRGH
jgi:hypothetical protein